MKKKFKKKEKINLNKSADYTNYFLLSIRYLILLAIVVSLPILYSILLIITINPLVFLLKLFYNASIIGNVILINNLHAIKIIPACVAGSAYLLLIILNLTIKMQVKKRILSLLFSISLLYIINLIRLTIFSIIYVSGHSFFDTLHLFTWYFLSTLFVIVIWFSTAKLFSIKEIPIYTDINYIINSIKK